MVILSLRVSKIKLKIQNQITVPCKFSRFNASQYERFPDAADKSVSIQAMKGEQYSHTTSVGWTSIDSRRFRSREPVSRRMLSIHSVEISPGLWGKRGPVTGRSTVEETALAARPASMRRSLTKTPPRHDNPRGTRCVVR